MKRILDKFLITIALIRWKVHHKMDSPALFMQIRAGQNSKPFDIFLIAALQLISGDRR
jgi:lipopolysaccharide/colanic/teichoic acid biosynthesis glycosyltransferase